MTRQIRIHATGGPEALTLDTITLGPPAANEVTLAVRAAGVNFIDTYHRSGLYALPSLPHGIGVEAAGVIEAIGDEVTDFAVGDRVAFAGGKPGAYADRVHAPAARLVRLPDDVDFATGAAVMLQGMTAEYLIERCVSLSEGDVVLVHAAAGGTGQLLCSWLRDRGVISIGVVGSQPKAEIARAAGATHVLVRSLHDVVAKTRELTEGVGVSVVYDSVGRDTLGTSLACLRKRGILVGFGNASGPPDPLDLLELSRRGSLYVTRPTLFDYVAEREELVASADAVFDRLRRGVLAPRIDATLPLAEASEAHRRLEGRETTGKLLLLP